MRSLSFVAVLLTACAAPTTMIVMPDSGDDPTADASPGDHDAGVQEDARVVPLPDSGTADSGTEEDAGTAPDSGTPDAGMADAGSTMTGDGGTDAGGDAGTSSGPAAVQLALGAEHSCVLRTDGRARCWGNPVHALGWGSDTFGSHVRGLGDGVAIAATGARGCALRPDGSVWCWGTLSFTGETFPSGGFTAEPVRIAGIAAMDEIAGQCGVTTAGTVQCWDTSAGGVTAPPAGITGAIDIDQFDTSFCALRSDGAVACWGPAPSVAPFVAGLTHVSVSNGGACALTSGGAVFCWDASAPAPVGRGGSATNTSPYVEIGSGQAHTCGRRADGSVWCWGRNDFGQLGRTTSVTTDTTAGEVLLGTWVPGGMTSAPVIPDYY